MIYVSWKVLRNLINGTLMILKTNKYHDILIIYIERNMYTAIYVKRRNVDTDNSRTDKTLSLKVRTNVKDLTSQRKVV